MAAYGAALSLLKTLSRLLNTPNYPKSQIKILRKGINSLKCFLDKNREVKREFETQIRDAIYEAQDMIDSHMLSIYFLSPSEAEIRIRSFCQDLKRVEQKISSIAQMTKKKFNHQTLDRKLNNWLWKSCDEINCTIKYRLVGRDEDLIQLKDRLMSGSASLQVVPIVGIAGMGKTALVHCLLEDQLIKEHFDATYWVKVSSKYNKRDILLDLLGSIKKRGDGIRQEIENEYIRYLYNCSDVIRQKTDEQLEKHLYNSLKYKTYLILLDDIREVAAWNDLKHLFPDYHSGSRILLTTRNMDVAPSPPHQLNAMSDMDTLTLLWNRIFYGKPGPPYLGDIAMDIARSCRGLPHAVVFVGNLLSCARPIAKYWVYILSLINTYDNYDDLIKALVSLTYKHLPQCLKVSLLYMAIFPYNDRVPLPELTALWAAERFLEDIQTWTRLARRGLLVGYIKDRDKSTLSSAMAEEVFHDFLMKKAKKEKFFHVINKDTIYTFPQEDTTFNQQRRLCIQQNIHHFIKDRPKYNSNSFVRSLIYSGPKHQYPLSVWLEDFKLLEILEALKIDFYCFPPGILKLFQLRYLALSYNGELPATLCNLQNLQFLIVSHYLNLKCSGVPSYLPAEIWNLKDLVQLRVMGSDLPEPPSGTDPLLEKLSQLSYVSAHSCTRNIFGKMPHLRTLEVRIESSPEDESLSFFIYLDILNHLAIFECVVVYPQIVSQVVPCSIPAFPSTLWKLTLNGCGFPWEYMMVIASLPKLRYLNLKTCAFQGPEWEVKTDEFPKLEFLWLEDMDFEKWTFTSNTGSSFPMWDCLIRKLTFTSNTCSSFPMLESLVIRHCYKLRNIPSVFEDSLSLKMLEVVDCSTSAMNSALEIKEKLGSRNDSVQFNFYSSLDD